MSHGVTVTLRTSPTTGHLPVVVVSVKGAEHHAVVNGHRAVFTEQFRGSLQETVAGVAGVAVDRHHVVGRLRLDGELTVLGVDLKDSRKHVS